MSENINDINHLDTDDVGLSQIFGDRFQDMSKSAESVKSDTARKSTTPSKKNASAVIESPEIDPVTQAPHPVEFDPYGWLPKLKSVAYGIIPPSLLCSFFFWCQLTKRMDSTTAVIAMFACVAIVFFRVGRVCTK